MVKRISAKEAYEKMVAEGYVYLDVRTEGEFESGRPAGSFNVPIAVPGRGGMVLNEQFLAVVTANFSLDTRFVVGCQSGVRSQRACTMLEDAGFADVLDQRAGWGGAKDSFGRVIEKGWAAESLPCAFGPDAERGYAKLKSKLHT
jgi:rhodanese-related sulfurtransferase